MEIATLGTEGDTQMENASMSSLIHSPIDCRQFIEKLANDKLRVFKATIDLATGNYLDDPYAQNKSLSEHVAADYHGRFLTELIQNANDAHPPERRDGEIQVHLSNEGKHGVLYVANRGSPFSKERVSALSRIGKSSKPPGESIGNKGLGFRSVSHVCEAPEIYSQTYPPLTKETFTGFCFALEHGRALDSYFDDQRTRELAAQDLPMFSIPRWLPSQPERVKRFARSGFATVVRLPLRNAVARADAVKEIQLLANQSAPLLLFMERLCRLTATIEGSDSSAFEPVVLERTEAVLLSEPLSLALVNLGRDGRFLVSRERVPEAEIKPVIESGVASKQLHSSWNGWTGDGEVAISARIDDGPVSPRLFTFLPLGEAAAAPFNGYLHGSFFPSSNRKAIDASIKLNSLLLRKAVWLAAKTVRWIAQIEEVDKEHLPLDLGVAARAVVDFLAWSKVSSLEGEGNDKALGDQDGRLDLPSAVAREIGSLVDSGDFADAQVVPCLGSSKKNVRGGNSVVWRAPGAARSWIGASETFTVACLADHGHSSGIAPLWAGLGDDRTKRLIAFKGTQAAGKFVEKPTLSERAEIATSLAASLPIGRNLQVGLWTSFYRDLVGFMGGDATALVGRELILCADNTLRAGRSAYAADSEADTGSKPRRRRRQGEKVEASLFFPPAPRATVDGSDEAENSLNVPWQLKEYFAFVSELLPWHGALKRAREFLEDGLVSAYDGETVLTRISQVMNSGASTEETIAGLRWAFTIWRHAGERLISNERKYRLLVPTAEHKIIPATEAIFSESWPDETLGKRLEQFLDAAPTGIADLAELRARRLAPTTHRAFGKARITQWTDFLVALGVRRGLVAVERVPERSFRAYELTSFRFCSELGIPKGAADMWKADVGAAGISLAYTTKYNFKGKLWWLLGQADYESYSNDCRELYAALIVDWLGYAPANVFTMSVTHSYYSETKSWSTPVGAFLRSAKWMPADDPSQSGEPVRGHFVPNDVWIAAASGERFPFYLRQPAVALAKAVERAPKATIDLLVSHGRLKVLSRTETLLDQARFLADQYRIGTVNRYYEPQFVNLYHATWKALADRYNSDPAAFTKSETPPPLVVRQGGEWVVVEPKVAGVPAIFVRDSEDEIVPGLIDAVGGLMLDVKGADRSRVGRVLRALYGERIKLVSTVQYDVRADNTPIDEILLEPLAINICPWLRPMVAVAIESLKGTDASRLPTDRSSFLEKLSTVVLHSAKTVVFKLDGTTVWPDNKCHAYFFRRSDGTPLVVTLHERLADWAVLEECIPKLCDAIELPSIAMSMRLMAHGLKAAGTRVGERQFDEEDISNLCRTLYLDDQASSAARNLLSERLDARLPWLRALVHFVGGAGALETLLTVEARTGGDAELLRVALASLLTSGDPTPDAALEACRRSFTKAQFRERLGIEFSAFNESLVASGAEPDTYPQIHSAQLVSYAAENEIEIIEALRNAMAPKLEKYEPAPEYARLRDGVRSIAPDQSWLLLYKTVPDQLIASRVLAWLAEVGAPGLGDNPSALPSLLALRKSNNTAVANFAVVAAPLVRTWCAAQKVIAPEIWTEGNPDARLRAALDAAGVMDFRELDETGLLNWCFALNLWPHDMGRTLDRGALGIEATDIEAANNMARQEAEKREAKDRCVPFNGKDEDPLTADWLAISEVIASNLSKKLKSTTLGSLTELAPVEQREDREGRRPPKGSSDPTRRVPQPKKDMIGRLGELVVYHWLKDRLPNQDIDKAWVSKNGSAHTGRLGSDEHGYDFEVEYRKQTWQIEVKASLGDSQRFEMGETEVRAAREAARARSKVRYVVVYVGNPHELSKVRLDVLPNPMSAEADGVLDLLGEGVRYGFRRR